MIPEAFLARMSTLPGLDFSAFYKALERPPVRALRVNPVKTDEKTLLPLLPFATEPLTFLPGAFLAGADKVGALPAHHAGMFYMQDPSAISAVAAVPLKAGIRAIDLCAAPGGKTTQIAAAIGESGVLVANEYVPARCRILQGNVERLGLSNTVVTNLDTGALADFYGSYFDFVAADAPCSGEGMFRKYEVAPEEWSPENVALCAARQKEILENAARLTRPGGMLLYSTCTFSVEENEANVDAFLTGHPDFHLIPAAPAVAAVTADGIAFPGCRHGAELPLCRRFYPHLCPGEGQFLALFRREETAGGDRPQKSAGKGGQKEGAAPLTPAETHTVSALIGEFCENLPPRQPVFLRGMVCLSPGIALPPRGVFAAGVTLGELTHGRLVPHHHFYSAFGRRFLRRLELKDGDERVLRYLAGEELDCPELASANGFAAVLYENAPTGGGKAVNGRLKNHYPKGLRRTGG